LNKAFQNRVFFEKLTRMQRALIILWLALLPGILWAEDEFGDFKAKSEAALLVSPATAKAGTTVEVGVRIKIPKGWHIYWRNPGENGLPTSLEWALPKGITAGAIQWPVPEKVEWLELFTYGYHDEVLLIVPLTLAENLPAGDHPLKAKVSWLECEETCIPGDAEVSAVLKIGSEAQASSNTELFETWRARWPVQEPLEGTTAEWDGTVNTQGERRLKLTVPAKAATKVQFLPFEVDPDKTPWEMAHASTVTRGDDTVTLSKLFKSESGQWPATLEGVLRFEEAGKVRGYPVTFKLADAEAPPIGLDPFSPGGFNTKGSEANAMLDHTEAVAGSEVWAGVQWKLREHWHLFWKDPGMPGLPPEFHWTLPKGITASEIHWPKHKRMEILGQMGNVYEGEVMLLAPLTVSKSVAPGDYEIGLKVDWQECYETCEQHSKEFTLTLKVAAEAQLSEHASAIKEWRAKVPGTTDNGGPPEAEAMSFSGMLLFAFIGGIILNVMPCVLPVISMKILGFVQQAEEDASRVRKLGLTYGLGVLFSFLVLAGVLISVKESTGMAGWGMQMQNPYFTFVLMLVVMLVALNLFGVFEVTLGGGAMTKANELASREGYLGAFFNGILATALATPCTAPFLASAMGAALTQSNGTIIASMCAVGAGLAFPYVLLSAQPGWMKFLPKPGAWMEQFKQVMGFPMLAAAFWVMHFAGKAFNVPDPHKAIFWLAIVGTLVALAAWVFGEFKQKRASQSSGPLIASALLLLMSWGVLEVGLDWRNPKGAEAGLGQFVPTDANGTQSEGDKLTWLEWSPESVAAARADGRVVLVDFTADWCNSCHYTKAQALDVASVKQKLAELRGVAFLADWTVRDKRITKVLHAHKRAGVPLVLVYPVSGEPIVLPPVMSSPEKVLEALDKAGRPAS